MTEPQVQYAKTSDGVSIAFASIGQGPAVLYLIMPMSHLSVEIPEPGHGVRDSFHQGWSLSWTQNATRRCEG